MPVAQGFAIARVGCAKSLWTKLFEAVKEAGKSKKIGRFIAGQCKSKSCQLSRPISAYKHVRGTNLLASAESAFGSAIFALLAGDVATTSKYLEGSTAHDGPTAQQLFVPIGK